MMAKDYNVNQLSIECFLYCETNFLFLARVTHNIFAHNIAIKKDKKILR